MGYSLLSKYRSELMGAAMLWVMLFHAWDLEFELEMFNLVRGAGCGGVDVFILLSAMGLAMSLGRREQEYASFMARRAKRILPAYFVVMVPYTLYLILVKDAAWSALVWNGTLLYYWMRSSGAFNWYVAGVMTFYAITPFCFRKLRDSKHRIALTGAAVFLSFALCRLLVREDYWYDGRVLPGSGLLPGPFAGLFCAGRAENGAKGSGFLDCMAGAGRELPVRVR